MNMTFRWYGKDNDAVTLENIKEIPGVKGIVWALQDVPAGEVWTKEAIKAEVDWIESYGFHVEVVESVNVHESIKLGDLERDRYIENYKESIRNLAEAGVKVICYNFMPIFDWTRTEMFHPLKDGSTALFFEKSKAENLDPQKLVRTVSEASNLTLPGWEPEKRDRLSELFEAYKEIDETQLWANLEYFLKAILPTAEEAGIKMAIHPDDPPYSIFGLPRIIPGEQSDGKLIGISDSASNAFTMCTGSMGASLSNNMVEVAILNRTAEKGADATAEIDAAGGEALALAANVLDRASLEKAKTEIQRAFGKIDILINGAGGNHPDAITGPETYDESAEGKSFFDLEEEGFSNVFSVNFIGTFLAGQVFGKELLKSESPAIVNLSPMSLYAPMTTAYSAAKASINNFTMRMAVHFAEKGLRVNSIAPGFFLTTQNRGLLLGKEGNPTARPKKILTATPMKKFGQPEELLGALLFLVDESYASFVTGTTLAVDGGFMAYSGV